MKRRSSLRNESALAVDDVVLATELLVRPVAHDVEFDVAFTGDDDLVGSPPRIDQVGGVLEIGVVAVDEDLEREVVVDVAGDVRSLHRGLEFSNSTPSACSAVPPGCARYDEDTTTHAQAHTDTHAHNMRYELQAQGKQANAACAMHSNDGNGTSTAATREHSQQNQDVQCS